ncbi:MAG: hypothetical protein PVI23_13285 [Maricaulaceae bacterium]
MAETYELPATLEFARWLGAFLAAIGLSRFTARSAWREIGESLQTSRAISFAVGVLVFVVGAAVAIGHEYWVSPLSAAVTIVGNGLALFGLALIVRPSLMLRLSGTLCRAGDARLVAFFIFAIGVGFIVAATLAPTYGF